MKVRSGSFVLITLVAFQGLLFLMIWWAQDYATPVAAIFDSKEGPDKLVNESAIVREDVLRGGDIFDSKEGPDKLVNESAILREDVLRGGDDDHLLIYLRLQKTGSTFFTHLFKTFVAEKWKGAFKVTSSTKIFQFKLRTMEQVVEVTLICAE